MHWIYAWITVWGIDFDLFPKQWFIPQWILSVTMEKSWTPIDFHCKNFNSLILTSHTWNIPRKCPSQIYKQWKSWLGHFLGMFHVWEVRIKLLKFLQWKSMGVHDFSIVTDRIHWGINHCFGNKSKSIPHTDKLSRKILVLTFISQCFSYVIAQRFFAEIVLGAP